MANVQIHFDLADWEEAFDAYRESHALYGDEVVLILSTNPYTEGYWVESRPDEFQLPPTDKMYAGDEVSKLEQRVKNAVASQETNKLIS